MTPEPVVEAAPEAAPAPEPVEEGKSLWFWILLLLIVAIVVWLVARNRDKKKT